MRTSLLFLFLLLLLSSYTTAQTPLEKLHQELRQYQEAAEDEPGPDYWLKLSILEVQLLDYIDSVGYEMVIHPDKDPQTRRFLGKNYYKLLDEQRQPIRRLRPQERLIVHGKYGGGYIRVRTQDGTQGLVHQSSFGNAVQLFPLNLIKNDARYQDLNPFRGFFSRN